LQCIVNPTYDLLQGVITFVHFQQSYEKNEMKKGVKRDIERLKLKENQEEHN
jgi:hypothetical protein